LQGIQTLPPEYDDVPPTLAPFSMTSGERPSDWARSEAVRPAAPLPTISTSVSKSQRGVLKSPCLWQLTLFRAESLAIPAGVRPIMVVSLIGDRRTKNK
jgi:hypothetical protein